MKLSLWENCTHKDSLYKEKQMSDKFIRSQFCFSASRAELISIMSFVSLKFRDVLNVNKQIASMTFCDLV